MMQKQIWAFQEDILKIRKNKAIQPDGKPESDAKALNRLLKQMEDKLAEADRKMENKLTIRFDGEIRK